VKFVLDVRSKHFTDPIVDDFRNLHQLWKFKDRVCHSRVESSHGCLHDILFAYIISRLVVKAKSKNHTNHMYTGVESPCC